MSKRARPVESKDGGRNVLARIGAETTASERRAQLAEAKKNTDIAVKQVGATLKAMKDLWSQRNIDGLLAEATEFKYVILAYQNSCELGLDLMRGNL